MMNEETRRILGDERAQNVVLRNLKAIARHPVLSKYLKDVQDAEDLTLDITPEEFAKKVDASPSLEKIVKAINRPALLIKGSSFEIPIDDYWFAKLSAAREGIERAIRAVGRIEVREPSMGSHIGTGWLIAPDVVITNRHVAREFARENPPGRFVFRMTFQQRPYRPVVDLLEEYGQMGSPLEFDLDQVLYIAPDDDTSPDLAFLHVNPAGRRLPQHIRLSERPLRVGSPVAAIGYPAYDYNELDRDAMVRIFDGIFDVKRLSPGEVMIPPAPGATHFRHDCATLGGNSGSVIVDLETGGAVGVHFAGTSGEANYAVSVEALKAALNRLALRFEPVTVVEVGDRAEPLAEEERRTPADYADRDGYKAGFLGANASVPLPQPVPARAQEIAPLVHGNGTELKYRHFSVIVNGARRFPMITGVNIDGTKLRRVPGVRTWKIDPRIAPEHQIDNRLYRENNLDRGHMVRRLDPVWGTLEEAREANDDTHHYTNACPQDHSFNDQVWGDLEDHILDAAPDDEKLSVLTGPVLADDDPDYRGVKIPRSFWKVVAWRDSGLKVAAFVLTQDEYLGNLEFNPYKFSTYHTTLAEVETLASISFGTVRQADVLGSQEAARPRRLLESVREFVAGEVGVRAEVGS